LEKGKGEDSHSTANIDGPQSDLGESGGNENPGGNLDGYPPATQTPPLLPKYGNGNSNFPPPAPSIPPPPMDDDNDLVYENGHGRLARDSEV